MLKITFIVGLCLLFWGICYLNTGNDQKNMIGFRSYPKEVQELVKKDPVLGKKAPKEINMFKILVSNFILFTVIFLIVGLIIKYTVGFSDFMDAFVYFLVLGETLNLFDLIVIDLLWWRNTERIRFSCVPDKALYQNPSVHIASFIRAIVMYFVIALLVAAILNVLP